MASFNATVDSYRIWLANVDAGNVELVNENIDVGTPTVAGKYLGADLAYDKLLGKLADSKFAGVSAELRGNILNYYEGRKPPVASTPKKAKKASADWAKLLGQVDQLRQVQTEIAPVP